MISPHDYAALHARASGTPGGRKRKPKVRTCPSEDEEMTTLFSWSRLYMPRYPALALLWHLKSEGTTWSWRELARAQATGVKPGIPDLGLFVSRRGFYSWFGELKALDGTLSEPQRQVLAALRAEGHFADVFYGWEKVRESLLWYLSERE